MDIESLTEDIRKRVGEDSGLGARIKFDLGESNVIYVDGSVVPNVVNNDDTDADCTIRMSVEDFESLLAGDLDPTTAFMMGKLKVDGDMGIAMKLSSVL
jgi:putative sterol carrier protein